MKSKINRKTSKKQNKQGTQISKRSLGIVRAVKVTPPSQSGSRVDSGSNSGLPTSSYVVSPMVAARDLGSVIENPFSDAPLADWPDPFTMIPTRKSKDIVHQSLTIYNGAANDGGTGVYLRGDPFHAWGVPSSVDTSTNSTKYTISWASCTNNMNSSMPTGTTSAAYARPVAVGHRFTFSAVGPYHTIIARVMELPPWGPVSSGYMNFPTKTSLGPTFAQREFFRAREIVMNPGETLQINLYPADALSLAFAYVDDTRENDYTRSWSGAVVWFHGLATGDVLYHDGIIHHSWFLPSVAEAPSTSPLPAQIVKPNTAAKEAVIGKVIDNVSSGWNIFKSVINTLGTIAAVAAPFVMGTELSSTPPRRSHELDEWKSRYDRIMAEGRGGGQRLQRIFVPPMANVPPPSHLHAPVLMSNDMITYKPVGVQRIKRCDEQKDGLVFVSHK